MEKKNIGWLVVVVVLLAVIGTGAGSVWARHRPESPAVVRTVMAAPDLGRIYIGGAVNAPGWYPLRSGDTLDSLVAAAGGLRPGAASTNVSLTVGPDAENPQRVNINTAAAWLLEALPGIGETKAEAIVQYREENGPFRDTSEITNVPGIGAGLYDGLRDLITVGE